MARVLIIDDDEAIGRMLARRLAGAHVVTAVRSGNEALAHIANHDFDVVLCDVNMPGMTGVAVHAAIAKRDAEQARRVVFMTGGTSSFERLGRLSNRTITKPIDMDELRRLVDGFLPIRLRERRAR